MLFSEENMYLHFFSGKKYRENKPETDKISYVQGMGWNMVEEIVG